MRRLELKLGIALVSLTFLSCAQHLDALPPVSLDFFVPAPDDNPWQHKIQNWQARHHLDPVRRGETPRRNSDLAAAYDSFRGELRERIARDTVAWVQEHSRRYYRADGDRDHWATLSEVIESGGDDCDGLDLLTFELLRKMGFGSDEIYRSIVVEARTGQHHMVTLWFDGANRSDPWLLDPTGVVTSGMVRLSAVPAWEPIELFDERAHFRVEPRDGTASEMKAALASR